MSENTDYEVIDNDGVKSVTVVIDGEVLVTTDSNPNFETIVLRLFEGDTDNIADLFDAEQLVVRKFKQLSERVAISGGVIYFDGDVLDDAVADHMLRLIKSGDDVMPLVNFWEKIATNPSEHSRVHLMNWLRDQDFTITYSGDIIAYKGLREDGTSIHSGPGIIDGKSVVGHLPNEEGSVIEMARSQVTFDPSNGCAHGLHVGTYGYARSFSQGRLVEVIVHPRDVVSVPTDCAQEKMRVCRYTVGKTVEVARTEAVVTDYAEDNDFTEDYGDDWYNYS